MPLVTVNFKDLEQISGLDKDTVLENISMIGAEIERVGEDSVDLEFFPNRPDLYSVEGVARASRTFIGNKRGLLRYEVEKPEFHIKLSEEVKSVRPILGCAVVKDVKLDENAIVSLMDLQEDLHWALGRGRKKVSIGVHDIRNIYPPFSYETENPDFEFIPLDYTEKMSMKKILEEHPKGIKFAEIVSGMDRYPIIKDSKGNVLSFPPIINGTLTTVTENTKDIFIDVTGTSKEVYLALNIVVAALYERGGKITGVEIINPDNTKIITPDMRATQRTVTLKEIKDLSGIEITEEEVIESLNKMGYDASCENLNNEIIFNVLVPAYRADIIHNADIIEDIVIGYGYRNVKTLKSKAYTVGKEHKHSKNRQIACEIMVGLGFNQVMPFTLTNEKIHFENMQKEVEPGITYVKHPITREQTMVRSDLLPGLLEILALNRHRELPQKIFEVGDVVKNKKNKQKIAAVSIHHFANFTEISELVDAFLRELSVDYELEKSKNPSYLKGRRADIIINGKKRGTFGELDPAVITAFELGHAVVGFEADLEEIMK